MRLAVFTTEFPSRGITFFIRDMLPLIEAGIEVEIFPVRPLNPAMWKYVPEDFNFKQYISSENRLHHGSILQGFLEFAINVRNKSLIQENIKICDSALNYGLIPFLKTTYTTILARDLARQDLERFDHILAYWGNYAGTCAYLAHRLSNLEIPFSIFLHAGTDLYRDQVYLKEKILYADHIITCIKFNLEFLTKLYPEHRQDISEKTLVHYHGLDFTQLAGVDLERSHRKIIAVGRFGWRKGFDYLLRAIHELDQKGVKLDVELIGGGKEAGRLRELAERLQIGEKVALTDWLPPSDVFAKMRQATVLVHPSPELGDGAPNVIKEAMAFGTPVVASDIAGIPEILDHGKCGILVPPKDVNSLTSGIERLIMNDQLREQYAQLGQEFARKKFDMWKNGRQLVELLRSTSQKRDQQ